MKRSIIPVFVPHFGCPNGCVFCNQHTISGSAGQASVSDEVSSALRYAGLTPQIAFYGGSFTAIEPREQEAYLSAAFEFVKAGQADSVRVSTRPDCINEEILERLRRYGVRTIELGVQSLDDAVLCCAKRGHSAEDCIRSARLIREKGFELVLQMMTGLPGDSGRESRETAERICALRPDAVRIYPAVVLPGTELSAMWRHGEYKAQSVEEATELCADLLEMFLPAGIPVIRLGLNPSRELESEVLAGAYHPALGDLVRGRLYQKRAAKALSGLNAAGRDVSLTVGARQVSTMVGNRRCNVEELRSRFRLRSLKVIPGALPDFAVEATII